eukprot:6189982-Pleurochrysis_carterae.AAC.1
MVLLAADRLFLRSATYRMPPRRRGFTELSRLGKDGSSRDGARQVARLTKMMSAKESTSRPPKLQVATQRLPVSELLAHEKLEQSRRQDAMTRRPLLWCAPCWSTPRWRWLPHRTVASTQPASEER